MNELDLQVVGRTDATDRIAAFELCRFGGGALPAWDAGAHIRVDLPGVGSRAYSLIRWGAERVPGLYRIAVQHEPGGAGGSAAMHRLKVGDRVTASAPACDFPLRDAPAVLLAGGIGVTPLISMAAELTAAGLPFDFVYAVRSAGAALWPKALRARFGAAIRADDASPVDLDAVVAGLGERHLYLCGPRGMIDTVRSRAEAAGVPADRVHVELFENGAAVRGGAFEVVVASTGATFTVFEGQSIVDVLEAAGVDVVSDCRRGDCGICQTGVLEGEPDHRDVVLSEAERAAGRVMQICVSRAKSARLVLDL